RLRAERLRAEAEDPETAAILLDVVLGYGAHPDPAGALAPALAEARAAAQRAGRHLPPTATVVRTAHRRPELHRPAAAPPETGALVSATNAEGGRGAAAIAPRGQVDARFAIL